jgi:hypothetical protein
LQGFRATTCRVNYRELLERTINGTTSQLAAIIKNETAILAALLADAITELHWKDLEILADLVFQATGWIRVSILGQQAKAYDIEMRELITEKRYVVQVKSEATRKDLDETYEQFSTSDYTTVFFVVHSPDASLSSAVILPANVKLVLAPQLATLALEAGLVRWIADKVS